MSETTRAHADVPIFRLDAGERAVLYTPGRARSAHRALASDVEAVLAGKPAASADARELADELVRDATRAARTWEELAERPFEPECLTLYLSNRCNLACRYCCSAPHGAGSGGRSELAQDDRFPVLSERTIEAAARFVARHCAAKRLPLTLVLHGGGEPTLHWDLLMKAHAFTAAAAAEQGIKPWYYVATHGVLDRERVEWLAAHFDKIGLSCDGPADIHNVNRPTAGGKATAPITERTARTLHELGADFTVRATITPETAAKQAELVEYFVDVLAARSISFEPAYDGRREPGGNFRPADAESFAAYFLEARRAARAHGCELQLSGVRIDELHGPFCNPLRDVLQLRPDGRASACFLSADAGDAFDGEMEVGAVDPLSGELRIDAARLATLRRRAAHIPTRCGECHNAYHCARDCPDTCLLSDESPREPHGGFRCRVQMAIGRNDILESAQEWPG